MDKPKKPQVRPLWASGEDGEFDEFYLHPEDRTENPLPVLDPVQAKVSEAFKPENNLLLQFVGHDVVELLNRLCHDEDSVNLTCNELATITHSITRLAEKLHESEKSNDMLEALLRERIGDYVIDEDGEVYQNYGVFISNGVVMVNISKDHNYSDWTPVPLSELNAATEEQIVRFMDELNEIKELVRERNLAEFEAQRDFENSQALSWSDSVEDAGCERCHQDPCMCSDPW